MISPKNATYSASSPRGSVPAGRLSAVHGTPTKRFVAGGQDRVVPAPKCVCRPRWVIKDPHVWSLTPSGFSYHGFY